MYSYQLVSPFLRFNSFIAVNKIKKSPGNNKMKRVWKAVSIGLLLSLLALFSSPAFAAEATLAWNPNTESDVEGYGVYFSQDDPGPPYSVFGYVTLSELSDSGNPTFTVTGLETDTRYYFAVTAFDTAGNESDFSSSVCADVKGDIITLCASDASGSFGSGTNTGGSGGGGGGGGCFIGSSAVGVGWLHPSMEALIVLCWIAAFAWFLGRKPFVSAFISSRHPKPKNGFDR
jgi:hypothetical protein